MEVTAILNPKPPQDRSEKAAPGKFDVAFESVFEATGTEKKPEPLAATSSADSREGDSRSAERPHDAQESADNDRSVTDNTEDSAAKNDAQAEDASGVADSERHRAIDSGPIDATNSLPGKPSSSGDNQTGSAALGVATEEDLVPRAHSYSQSLIRSETDQGAENSTVSATVARFSSDASQNRGSGAYALGELSGKYSESSLTNTSISAVPAMKFVPDNVHPSQIPVTGSLQSVLGTQVARVPEATPAQQIPVQNGLNPDDVTVPNVSLPRLEQLGSADNVSQSNRLPYSKIAVDLQAGQAAQQKHPSLSASANTSMPPGSGEALEPRNTYAAGVGRVGAIPHDMVRALSESEFKHAKLGGDKVVGLIENDALALARAHSSQDKSLQSLQAGGLSKQGEGQTSRAVPDTRMTGETDWQLSLPRVSRVPSMASGTHMRQSFSANGLFQMTGAQESNLQNGWVPEAADRSNAVFHSAHAQELSSTRPAADSVVIRAEAARVPVLQVTDWLIRQSDRTVEISLNPRELGSVKMSMTTGEGSLTLIVTAERGETLDLMRRHIESLAQEFRRLGYSDLGFEFAQKDGSQHQRTQEAGVTSPSGDEDDTAEAHMRTPQSPRHSHSGLDLRI